MTIPHLHFNTPEAALSRPAMATSWCMLFYSFGIYFWDLFITLLGFLLLFFFYTSDIIDETKKYTWLQYTAVHVLGFDLPQLNFQNVGLGGCLCCAFPEEVPR